MKFKPGIENLLIFCRGVGEVKKTSTFSYEKLDKIISKIFTLFYDYKYTLKNKTIQNQKSNNVISRTPLTANIFELFGQSTVKEPTYEELIIIYRLKESKNEKNIFISSIKDIPMADIELAMPCVKAYLRPIDVLYVNISYFISVISLIYRLYTGERSASFLSIFSFFTSIGLMYITYGTLMQDLYHLILTLLINKT